MIRFSVVELALAVLIWAVSLIYIKRKKNKRNIYLIFYSVFFVYLIGVIKYTIFPIPILLSMSKQFNGIGALMKNVNLIPFKFTEMNMEAILNITLAIPFGFGLSYITKISFKKIILLSLLFGIGIETIQLAISLLIGFPYRIIDINDAIFSFGGSAIGYAIFKIFSQLVIATVKPSENEDQFIEYIYNVAKGYDV